MATRDQFLRQLFGAQAGVVSLDQLRTLGFSRAAIQYRRRSGEHVVVHPGVVRSASAPDSWLSEVVAAALFIGGRGCATGRLAARLIGLPGFERDEHIEFIAPTRDRGVGGRLVVHQSRRIPDEDTTIVQLQPHGKRPSPKVIGGASVIQSLATTTPTRTIIDLAKVCSVPSLARLVDSSVSLRLTTLDQLCDRLSALRSSGVSGIRKLDEVLIDAGVESWLERKFLELLREHGLPTPTCQVVFREGTRVIARVDFLFAGSNIVVEVSGRRGHVTDAERQKDARRRNALQRAGMMVLEFVTSDIVNDPAYVIATIRRALEAA